MRKSSRNWNQNKGGKSASAEELNGSGTEVGGPLKPPCWVEDGRVKTQQEENPSCERESEGIARWRETRGEELGSMVGKTNRKREKGAPQCASKIGALAA